jgi:hypothetical protein
MRFPRVMRLHRHLSVLVIAAVAVLAAAGGALAWHGFSSATIVSATFSATTVSNSQSQTCTAGNNDSIQVTDATYTGTATSTDTHLNGPITIHARSVFDATTGAGTVTGDVSIGSSGTGFFGRLVTVNVQGHLQGLLVGWEGGNGSLLGNVTSAFSTTGGFASPSALGTIGSGTGTDTAIVSTSSCQSSHDDQDEDDNGGNKFGNVGKFFSGLGDNHHHHGGGDNQH